MDNRFGCIVLKAPECKWENAHVTMLFIGQIKEFGEGKREEIIERLHKYNFTDVIIGGYATGQGSWKVTNKMTAFPVISPGIMSLHTRLKHSLSPIGVKHESKFPFNPHLTTPNDADIPVYLDLTPLQLWWGGKAYDIV